MQSLSGIDWTLFLAFWGAGLSTALAILKILEYRRDRPIVKITLKSGYEAFPSTTPYGDMTALIVHVFNAGRRPVTITHVSLMLPLYQRNLLAMDPQSARYPIELGEGKYHDVIVDEDQLKTKYKLDPSQYVAFANDASGKTYWSHNFLARFWRVGRMR